MIANTMPEFGRPGLPSKEARMSRHARKRKQIFAQKPIQGGLVIRTVLYWFYCLCTIFLFVAVGSLFSGNLATAGEMFAKTWQQFSPAVLASLFLLPLVILDVLRSSHRFVGPLIRLETEMKRLADGHPVEPIRFRKNDYWHELADQFNRIAEQAKATSDPVDPELARESECLQTVSR